VGSLLLKAGSPCGACFRVSHSFPNRGGISIVFSGGEETINSLRFIWVLVFLCSLRGSYKNLKDGDYAYGIAFTIIIPISLYFLLDLFNLLPAGVPHVFG
jgi:hypothetical protein